MQRSGQYSVFIPPRALVSLDVMPPPILVQAQIGRMESLAMGVWWLIGPRSSIVTPQCWPLGPHG
jgi:hypothetical protein